MSIQSNRQMRARQLALILGAFLLVITALLGFFLLQDQRRGAKQAALLAELAQDVGRYDEQSIVLRSTTRSQADKLAELYDAELRITEDGRYATLTLPSGTTIRDALARRESRAYIDEVSADYHARISELADRTPPQPTAPQITPGDSGFAKQDYLRYLNISSSCVQTNTYGNRAVAVIDTGIDTDHPDFSGCNISSFSYNASLGKAVHEENDWSLIEDEQGHGTAVAGIISASWDNGGIVGLAPRSELFVIKVECQPDGTFERTSDLVFAIYYAIGQNVDVINMSFGTYGPENPFEDAIQLARDNDIVCVAAAGNEGTGELCWPAADANVIGVGAMDADWNLAEYSNFGENADLVAPGSAYTTLLGGEHGVVTGTSMACPMVSAAVLLFMKEGYYYQSPQYYPPYEILYAACVDLGAPGKDPIFGYGALDVAAYQSGHYYDVTYHMLTDELENIVGKCVKDHPLQSFPTPERPYAVFDGWYYDIQLTEEVDYYEDIFPSGITLYAKWISSRGGEEGSDFPFTYTVLDDGTIEITGYTGNRRQITLPTLIDERVVASLGESAFANQTQLRDVILPQGLKHIGKNAFAGCAHLTTIAIPDSVTVIESGAFSGCIRMGEVSMSPESNLTKIGDFAFEHCARLRQITLPKGVTSVTGAAFFGATKLSRIAVQRGNTAFTSVDGILYNATGDTLVAFPPNHGIQYTPKTGIKHIGPYAFAYSLVSNVSFEGIESIGEFAFAYSCQQTVVIPDSVTLIGRSAFFLNRHLTTVTLGNGLKELSAQVFAGADNSFTEITIPAGIRKIGVGAFEACSHLTKVQFAPDSALDTIEGAAFAQCPIRSFTLPASVTLIGSRAFYNTNLTSIEIPSGSRLTNIGNEAFTSSLLLSISLPEGLTYIGQRAFAQTSLSTVQLPATLAQLGDGVFSYCSQLTSIEVAPESTAFQSHNGILYSYDMRQLYAYPGGRMDDGSPFPDSTEIIRPYAFAGATQISGLTFPQYLRVLGEYALKDVNLTLISPLPATLQEIGKYAFDGCTKLREIRFEENATIKRITSYAFANCGVHDIIIPASVEELAPNAFDNCSSLTKITFAKNSRLTILQSNVFAGCAKLRTVQFERNSALHTIQARALENLPMLRTLSLFNTKLTMLGAFSVRFCPMLQTLTLPDTLHSIGRFALFGCRGLSNLYIPAEIDHIGTGAFLGTKDIALYFSSTTLPARLDEGWDSGVGSHYVGVSEVKENEQFQYAALSSGGVAILKYTGDQTHVDLTQVDLGGPIVQIGNAFCDTAVQTVILPATLTQIQSNAFSHSALTEIVIPKSVTFIGREAFAFTDLASITFEQGSALATIEQYAFQGTEKLTAIALPASLTELGTGVFEKSGLQSVHFEAGISLSEIPQRAFVGTKLTEIALPDSVSLVNYNAFHSVTTLKKISFGRNEGIHLMSNAFYHTGLESLHIPENITYIGEYCFVALTNLRQFTVSEENPSYKAVDGVLMSKNGRILIAAPAAMTGSYTVPVTVEEIGFGAFEESRLSEIILPDSINLLSIGYRAFFKAENLTQFHIPASVISINYYAFGYCTDLHTVTIASDSALCGIYEGVFEGCMSLQSLRLPDTVKEIGDFAFYGCESIKALPFSPSAGVEVFGRHSFAYSGLEGALHLPSDLIRIDSYALMQLEITELTVPSEKQKELVIGLGAFAECHKLTSVTLPFIGSAFEEEATPFSHVFGLTGLPDSLKTVTIAEGIRILQTRAFYRIQTLEHINLPHSITDVHEEAMCYCPASYKLTNELDILGEYALSYSGLTGHVTLREGTLAIPEGAFNGCRKLTSVTLPETLITVSSFEETGLTEVHLPDSVREIGYRAFYSSYNLHAIHLPQGLETIGGDAFGFCDSLREVTLPASLNQIDFYAFSGCDSLFTVYNQSELDIRPGILWENGDVGYYAKKVIDREGNRLYVDPEQGGQWLETPDGFLFLATENGYTLRAYLGKEQAITLPLTVQGQPYHISSFSGGVHVTVPEGFTSLPDYAFSGSRTLRSLILPNSLTAIGAKAFEYCGSLKQISFGSGLAQIGDDAFLGCYDLTSFRFEPGTLCWQDGLLYTKDLSHLLYVPQDIAGDLVLPQSLKRIDSDAFAGREQLCSIVIPESVTSLGENVFRGCTSLIRATVNANIEYLPAGMFKSCAILQSVSLPQGLLSIGQEAFASCGALTELPLPSTVKYLHNWAFAYCNGLTGVTLPAGVENLGNYLFASCKNLTEIHLPTSVTNISRGSFYQCTNLERITVAEGNPCFLASENILYSTVYQESTPDGIVFIPYSYSGEVTVPEGTTFVSDNVFNDRNNITSVHLPASVQYLNYGSYMIGAFQDMLGLTEITVDEGNPYFFAQDGLLYDRRTLELLEFPNCLDGPVTIPEGVTEISLYSSAYSTDRKHHITDLYISSTVKKISSPSPETIRISEDNPYLFVDNNILYTRDPIEVVLLPATLPSHLVLPEGMTTIGDHIFYDRTELVSITVPSTVESIEGWAFNGCLNLLEVINLSKLDIALQDGEHGMIGFYAKRIATGGESQVDVRTTEDGFHYCIYGSDVTLISYIGQADTITLPETLEGMPYRLQNFRGGKHLIIPGSFAVVESYAFPGNRTLESVTIENGPTAIGRGAFYECRNLQKVIIPPSVETIDEFAFSFCNKLKHVELSEGLRSIESHAFQTCPLTNIQLPKSLTSIKDLPVSDDICEYRNGVRSLDGWIISVDEDVTYIDDILSYRGAVTGAYQNCTRLKTILWDGKGCASAETIIIRNPIGTVMPTESLRNIVLTKDLDPVLFYEHKGILSELNDIRIFVDNSKELTRYDENIYNWSNGNRVIYDDGWTWADFYDMEGHLISSTPRINAEVIRRPVVKDFEKDGDRYLFLGWDTNDDGTPDNIPAVTVLDFSATALFRHVHEHRYLPTVTPPTCTDGGYTTHLCRCGDSYTDTPVDPLDHEMGEWVTVKPASTKEEGTKRRTCIRCDHSEEDSIPMLKGPDKITSSRYHIGDTLLSKIDAGTTVSTFLTRIGESEYVTVYKDGKVVASSAKLGTGMEVRLVVEGQTLQTLTVVITGDVNGDGDITLTDMLAIKSHLLKKATLTGTPSLAGDVNADAAVTLTDFIQIKAHILKKSSIVPQIAKSGARP